MNRRPTPRGVTPGRAVLPAVLFGFGLWPGAVGCVFDLAPPVPGDAGTADPSDAGPPPDPGCEAERPVRCGRGCLPTGVPCLPAELAGIYEVTLVTRDDQCALEGFGEPGTTSVLAVVIDQQGEALEVRVDGLAGFLLSLGFGGDPVLTGTVEGDAFVASFVGNRSFTEGGCTWTIQATVDAEVTPEGGFLGDLVYTPRTNGHPDCAVLPVSDCRSVQRLTAVPQEGAGP
ncbi:MAG TPA: hypothetical protein RMF84_17510 [Polyangiaceae bacterium LLY-WYZ-14_1]|nr:hypothetical protein [Polyangiaceae bacterium LLY-WYZ-14_1]